MSGNILVFDPDAVRLHRSRASRLPVEARFLIEAVAERLIDRLHDIRFGFATALDLGCGDGAIGRALGQAGLRPCLISADRSRDFAARHERGVTADEEALPFADGSLDLVLSCLALHWTNDLPGALVQIRRALRPDGLLLAAMWGTETLKELRESLLLADLELDAGAAPRVSPFIDLRDAGGLLQRAGFALPVVDAETLTVTYPDIFRLMSDLRGMGETNALLDRRRSFSRRAAFMRAGEIYAERFADTRGRLVATFQLVNLTAWAPAPSQPRALRRGSAVSRLAEALGSTEHPVGEQSGTRDGPSHHS